MSEEQPYQEIRQVYKDLTQTVEREKSGNRAWGRYGLGEQEYSNTFRIVSDESINEILEERKKEGKKNLVCDLMAGTGFLESIEENIDGGVAVGLGDGRNILDQEDDAEKGIDMVEGNLLSKKTWKKLKEELETKKQIINAQNQSEHVDGFTMITCRPLGGIFYLTKDINVHFWLLQNAYTLLSSDHGVLLTELPYRSDRDISQDISILKEWINELKETNPALEIKLGQSENGRSFALKLVKTTDCPKELPPLQRLAKQKTIENELKEIEAA